MLVVATIIVEGTNFYYIDDKALSVGEGSEMTMANATIESAGAGAVAKDKSVLKIKDSQISNSRIAALMAYVKKPEYGSASIQAEGLVIEGDAPQTRV